MLKNLAPFPAPGSLQFFSLTFESWPWRTPHLCYCGIRLKLFHIEKLVSGLETAGVWPGKGTITLRLKNWPEQFGGVLQSKELNSPVPRLSFRLASLTSFSTLWCTHSLVPWLPSPPLPFLPWLTHLWKISYNFVIFSSLIMRTSQWSKLDLNILSITDSINLSQWW